MSMFDKFLDAMRLNPDEDYDDDEYEYDEYDEYDDEDDEPSPRELRRQAAAEAKEAKRREKEEEKLRQSARREEKQVRQPSGRSAERFDSSFEKPAKAPKAVAEKPERVGRSQSKITPIDKAPRRPVAAGMEVVVIKPTTIEDELEVTDTLLDGRTVILNMEGFDISVAQRIIDFTSGSTYAIGGRLQKVSSFIFLATPKGVDISGDFSNIMENFESNGYDY